MTILIVEDEQVTRQLLINTAREIAPSVEILATASANQAFQWAQTHPITSFFLDIQIEDYSGLELAQRIRQLPQYTFVPIVFLTSMPTLELQAYRQVHCYDYLLKPFQSQALDDMFRKILIDYPAHKPMTEPDKLALEFKTHTQLIDYTNILYIEHVRRKLVIVTTDEVIPYIRIPLTKFIEQLPSYFIQIHQSIVVNKKKITLLNAAHASIKLVGVSNELPIGSSFLKVVKEKVHEHL